MRAIAILGPGDYSRHLRQFRRAPGVEWLEEQSRDAEAALIFGGDGTIHHQLERFADRNIPVLIVPCGSGNDFARALGLRSVADSLRAWNAFVEGRGNVRAIDLGVIRSFSGDAREQRPHYFCCVAGVGIDAEIARRSSSLPQWVRGHGGYALSAPLEFIRFTPFPLQITKSGRAEGFRPAILAAVANCPTFGGGMKIAPQAVLDDGKLDVCVVHAMPALKLFCLFPTVYFGQHLGFREVTYFREESVRLETGRTLEVYADGEYVCQTPVEFTTARTALTLIVPA
jgi:diacylglycerol kinase (ATP)